MGYQVLSEGLGWVWGGLEWGQCGRGAKRGICHTSNNKELFFNKEIPMRYHLKK